MQVVHARANQMVVKPRYTVHALPLICASTSAAPEEFLLAHFNSCAESCLSKLKDRNLRPVAMYSLLQLLWAYLHRCQESHTSVAKRLDPIIKSIFPPSRRPLNPPDLPTDVAWRIPHYIFHRHFELGSEIIGGLISANPPLSTTERWPVEALQPERMTIAIKAILFTLDALEKGNDPRMPPAPPTEDEIQSLPEDEPIPSSSILPESILCRAGMRSLLDSCAQAIARIASAADRASDSNSLLDDRNVIARAPPPIPFSPEREAQQIRRHGAFMVTYQKDRQPYFDLLRICIDSWPRLLYKDNLPDFKPTDILLRGLVHVDVDVYASSRQTLENLVRAKDGWLIVRSVGRFVVRPELVLRETAAFQGPATVKLEALVKLWLDLIKVWLDLVRKVATRSTVSHVSFRRPGAPTAAVEEDNVLSAADPKTSLPLIQDIEASALVLLCSTSLFLRKMAVESLRLSATLETSLSEWHVAVAASPIEPTSNRISLLLESAASLLTEQDEELLDTSERVRLQRWRRQPPADAITRLIESDNLADLSLWHHLLPSVMLLIAQECPSAMGLARPLIAARLIKAYPLASAAAGLVPTKVPQTPVVGRASTSGPSGSVDVAFLADHWQTHLMALCSVTFSTGAVVPTSPPEPGAQIDIDRLSSGVELVRLAVPFLASDNLPLRDAAIRGLGSINVALYRSLLEGLHSIIRHLAEDRRMRQDQRTGGRRSARNGRLYLSVARVHELASSLFKSDIETITDAEISLVCQYIKEAYGFLRDPESMEDAAYLPMRRAFSLCVQNTVECCASKQVLKKWFPTDLRHDLFNLFDSWSFRPVHLTSPDSSRTPGRSEHASHHHSKSRASSAGSTNHPFEVFLPPVMAMAALCVRCESVWRR